MQGDNMLEIEAEDDLVGVSWVNPAILQSYGGQLSDFTIMELFCSSPFYNENCINAVLARLRTIKRPEDRVDDERHILETYNGREYTFDATNYWIAPDGSHTLFTILRQHRKATGVADKPKLTTTGVYFVVDGIVFPSVTLLDVLRTYLVDSMHYFQKAMKHLATFTQFDVVKNYEWNKNFDETEEERPDPVKDVKYIGAADLDHVGSLLASWRQKYEVFVPPPTAAPAAATPKLATPTAATQAGKKRTATGEPDDRQAKKPKIN
eukprot:TRINITY_DN3660_c0_g1_i1.p1 TRINITY_DN3660_c0_g1~~TRINITY_DN3660_c0_g1_i1.p1  ORF type:complete len:274 (-),score=57.13 TRINITY_DN3660_c0_g1_i1:38-832(-)